MVLVKTHHSELQRSHKIESVTQNPFTYTACYKHLNFILSSRTSPIAPIALMAQARDRIVNIGKLSVRAKKSVRITTESEIYFI